MIPVIVTSVSVLTQTVVGIAGVAAVASTAYIAGNLLRDSGLTIADRVREYAQNIKNAPEYEGSSLLHWKVLILESIVGNGAEGVANSSSVPFGKGFRH